MDSIIITPTNNQDLELLTSIARRMGLNAKVLTEDEKEALGMAFLINEADRGKTVSREMVMKKLEE